MRPDQKKHRSSVYSGDQRNVRRPFDSSEIDRLPQPTEEDPPYRPWWIVEGPPPSEGTDPQA
jgi:hypothetical protein